MASGLALPSGISAVARAQDPAEQEEEMVTPTEDLMREHGVLERALLIYGETVRRLSAGEQLDPTVLARSAEIVRSFIEDYHERLEEEYLFPRFRDAGVLTELIAVLQDQHEAGRRVTDLVAGLAKPATLRDSDHRHQLTTALQSYITMYRPHAAREDTVLFPKLREIVSANEYDALGEEFEKIEHARFGEDGFAQMVEHIAALEKALGIYDLAQFTPR
jgi:hemerythrin-like domain-containing protein